MTVGLADTSIFIGYEAGRLSGADVPDDLAVSAVTVGELRLGVLLAQDVAARMRRLSTWELVSRLDAIEIDRGVATAWAGLVAELRQAGRRMPLNDSWIAATALAHDMPLVTQDSDFDDVPGLTVVRV